MTDPQKHSWQVRVAWRTKGRADAFIRKKSFEVGPALHFDAEWDGIAAVEYTLAALGADLVHGICDLARKRRVEIDHAEALVRGTVGNPLVWLDVVGETGDVALETLQVKMYLSTLSSQEEVQQLWEVAQQRSPLLQTLRRAAAVNLELHLTF